MASKWLLLLTPLVMLVDCGQKPVKKQMAVGEQVTILPIAATSDTSDAEHVYQNVHVVVQLDGNFMTYDEKSKLELFSKRGDKDPIYSFTGSQLKEMYATTHCKDELIKHLNNAHGGDGLFCNGALNPSLAHYFVADFPGDDDDGNSATSYYVNYVDNDADLISITISFP